MRLYPVTPGRGNHLLRFASAAPAVLLVRAQKVLGFFAHMIRAQSMLVE